MITITTLDMESSKIENNRTTTYVVPSEMEENHMNKQSLQAHQQYDGARFTKKMVFQQPGHNVFVLNFAAGQQLPAHRHLGATVYLLVVAGKGILTVDEQPIELNTGDIVQVEGDELMSYHGDEQEASSLYVTLVSSDQLNK